MPLAPVPNDIDIPFHNLTSDFTFQFTYKLIPFSDGTNRIILKSHDQAQSFTMQNGDIVRCTPGWKLYNGDGLPRGHFNKNLVLPGEKLIALSVASEILIAISNLNNIFMYKPTDKKRPILWHKKIGAPFTSNLRLGENISCWAFSASIGNKLDKQLKQIARQELTMYYQDATGEKHDSGICSTIYAVSKCRRLIYIWDTSLPRDRQVSTGRCRRHGRPFDKRIT
jgi:hypothetical protein